MSIGLLIETSRTDGVTILAGVLATAGRVQRTTRSIAFSLGLTLGMRLPMWRLTMSILRMQRGRRLQTAHGRGGLGILSVWEA